MDETAFDPGDAVLVSALEHWSYCPRQCGLIHVEQTFDENLYTLRGRHAHERVDQFETDFAAGVRVERGLPIWSDRLGLAGRADLVEFHGERPYPVEYKSGRKRRWDHEAIQVCAQGMCLEDMLGVAVPRGAVYYVTSKRRREIDFTPALRAQVEAATRAVRAMLVERRLPAAAADARCRLCSLNESCLPDVVGKPARLRGLQGALFRIEDP